MRHLVLGAIAGLVLSAATIATPASAAPVPTAAGALASQSDGNVTGVQMMRGERRMMRHRMMRHDRMMHRRMMHRRMMRRM